MGKWALAILLASLVLATTACATPFAYFVTPTGNLLVVDAATNTLAATVPIGASPFAAAVNPAGTRVYATNNAANSISVIDTSTNIVLSTVPVGAGPQGVAVNPTGTLVYVASFIGNVVSVIDPATNVVVTSFPLPAPVDLVVDPAGIRLYVSVSNAVDVIDTSTNTLLATIPTGVTSRVIGMAVTPDGARLYVGDIGNMQVVVIDTATNTVVTNIPIATPFTINGLALNPTGTQLYVSNGSTVSIINPTTNNIIASVPLGTVPDGPNGVAVTPDGAHVYASSLNGVRTFDTATHTVGSVLLTDVRSLGHFIGPASVAMAASFSGPTATGSGNATAAFACVGAPNCVYVKAAWIGSPGAAGSPPPLPGVSFPHGLFDFAIAAGAPGFTANLTLTFPQALPSGTVYYKYGPTAANKAPHWYVLPAVVSGNTITFGIVDGGLGDDDLAINAAIIDQGGPGVPVVISTLQPHAVVVLILLLGSIAILIWPQSKKRPHA